MAAKCDALHLIETSRRWLQLFFILIRRAPLWQLPPLPILSSCPCFPESISCLPFSLNMRDLSPATLPSPSLHLAPMPQLLLLLLLLRLLLATFWFPFQLMQHWHPHSHSHPRF